MKQWSMKQWYYIVWTEKKRKEKECKNSRMTKTNKGKLIILWKYAVYNSKKLGFIRAM